MESQLATWETPEFDEVGVAPDVDRSTRALAEAPAAA